MILFHEAIQDSRESVTGFDAIRVYTMCGAAYSSVERASEGCMVFATYTIMF